MQRDDDARAEDIDRFEGKTQEGVFCCSFYAGPHGSAAFGTVGARAGDIYKGCGEVSLDHCFSGGERDVVGGAAIAFFCHSGGGDTEAEEARVANGHFAGDRREVEEIRVHDFAEFFVTLAGGAAHDGENAFDCGVV